jgi:hypothetical protein
MNKLNSKLGYLLIVVAAVLIGFAGCSDDDDSKVGGTPLIDTYWKGQLVGINESTIFLHFVNEGNCVFTSILSGYEGQDKWTGTYSYTYPNLTIYMPDVDNTVIPIIVDGNKMTFKYLDLYDVELEKVTAEDFPIE